MKKFSFLKSRNLTIFLIVPIIIGILWHASVWREFFKVSIEDKAFVSVIISKLPISVYYKLQWRNTIAGLKQVVFPMNKNVNDPNELYIEIDNDKLNDLDASLPKSGREYKNANLFYNGEKFEIKMRYRGANYWNWAFPKKSYKIKLKGGDVLWGHDSLLLTIMKGATLMNEFVANNLAKEMGLLTRDEKYVKLFINNEYQGLYLYLEPIDKVFLEKNEKSVGDLFVGENFGDDKILGLNSNIFANPHLWDQDLSSTISSNREHLIDLTVLLQRFSSLESSDLYFEMEKIVDISYFKKFLAWVSLAQTFHYDSIHNIILYFDPNKGKFIQIPVDNIAWWWWSDPSKNLDIVSNDLYMALQKNPKFIYGKNKIIWNYLENNLIVKILDEIDQIYNENKDAIYSDFFKSDLEKTATVIPITNNEYENYLLILKNKIKNLMELAKLPKAINVYFKVEKISVNKLKVDFYIDGWSSVILDKMRLSCGNRNVKLIKSSGIFMQDNEILYSGREVGKTIGGHKILVPAPLKYTVFFEGDLSACQFENINVTNAITGEPVIPEKVDFFDESTLSTFSIHPWQLELEEKNYIKEELQKIKEKYPKFIIRSKEIIIPRGFHNIYENIIIPEGVETHIQSGTTLNMSPDTSFVSYGKVIAKGTSSQPIIVKAKDPEKPFGTFALANEGASGSHFNYFQIEHGSETNINGIYFSGMFSAYHNDDIVVENSKFSHSHSDDGLNFKYSNSKVLNSEFYQNSADAIDFDFMSGEIIGNKFIENGNDSIDTSGSTTLIKDNYIYKSGDKCMSFGEKSETIAINNVLQECGIGVEVKDLSTPRVINNVFIDNNQAINTYQKKEIFGGGHGFFANNLFTGNKEQITFHNSMEEEKFESDNSKITLQYNIFDDLPDIFTEKKKEDLCIECVYNNAEKIDQEKLKKDNFIFGGGQGDVGILKKEHPGYSKESVPIGLINKL